MRGGIFRQGWRRLAVWGAAALVGAALALPAAGAPHPAPGGPTVYGEVVQVGPSALVLSLAGGAWVAVNLTPSTLVLGPGQTVPGHSLAGVAVGDWALVSYRIERGAGAGGGLWLAALEVRYATAPFSLGTPIHVVGQVGAVYPSGFTLTAASGRSWFVSVTAATQVQVRQAGTLVSSLLSFLQVGDRVEVWGTVAGTTLTALRVVYALAPGVRGGGGGKGGGGGGGGRGRGRGRGHP